MTREAFESWDREVFGLPDRYYTPLYDGDFPSIDVKARWMAWQAATDAALASAPALQTSENGTGAGRMTTITEKLRSVAVSIRTKPTALSDFIPLLSHTADHIDKLEAEIDKLQAQLVRQQASYEAEIKVEIDAALERAAEVCETILDELSFANAYECANECAEAIRALKESKE